MQASRQPAKGSVYQITVALKGSRPRIWTRVRVRRDVSLHRLHHALQAVMGWQDAHLYEFEIAGIEYGEPHPDYGGAMKNARTQTLGRAVGGEGSKFVYRYDFGDGWEHELVVGRILPAQRGVRYPVCVGGGRACPPEDCGGVGGYAEFLKAVHHPAHAEHERWLAWIGGEFDPEAFDLASVNARLRSRAPAPSAPPPGRRGPEGRRTGSG